MKMEGRRNRRKRVNVAKIDVIPKSLSVQDLPPCTIYTSKNKKTRERDHKEENVSITLLYTHTHTFIEDLFCLELF